MPIVYRSRAERPPGRRRPGGHRKAAMVTSGWTVGIASTTEPAPAMVAHQLHALARIRPVPDDVPEAEDLVDMLAVDVSENRLECFEVAVDVADDGPFHADHFRRVTAPDHLSG